MVKTVLLRSSTLV